MALLGAGCRMNPGADFHSVQENISRRTGLKPEWPRSAAESDEAAAAVDRILARELTPETATQIAIVHNRTLRAAFEEIGISRSEMIQAGLLRNPRFGASLRFPDRPPSATDAEFSVAGDILDLLLRPLRKRVAALQMDQVKATVSHEILQLAGEVKEAFFTVQARQMLIGRLQAILEVNEAGVDLAIRQHKAGNITDLELANQEAVFQQAKLEWGKASAQARTDRERLNRLLGLWGPSIQWTVASELPAIPPGEVLLDHLETRAMEQRFDLAAARQQADLHLRALKLRAGTRYLPTSVDLGVNTERGTDGQRVTGPTLNLELPIFDQGQAALGRMESEYRRAQWRVEALATDIRSEVRQARDTMLAARDLADFYRRIYLPQRIRIANETLLQYNAMQKGTFDLIAAKERELNAEREYVESWRDYWIARTQLEKAIGGRLADEDETPARSNSSQKISQPEPKHEHKD